MSDTFTLTKKKDFTKPEFKASRAANATVKREHVLLDKFGKEKKESKSNKQVKKTLNNKTTAERNKKELKTYLNRKYKGELKKPNIAKKVIKSVAKKIIPGGALVGALTPKKMGDATLKVNEKPFVPKKKMGGVTKKK